MEEATSDALSLELLGSCRMERARSPPRDVGGLALPEIAELLAEHAHLHQPLGHTVEMNNHHSGNEKNITVEMNKQLR